MLVRAIIAAIVAGGLSFGALYRAAEYLGIEPIDQNQDYYESGGAGHAEQRFLEEERARAAAEAEANDDVPFGLPAEAEDNLGAWLAEVLAVETAVDVRAFQDTVIAETVDMGAYALNVVRPQEARPENPQAGDSYRVWIAECGVVEPYLDCFIGADNRWWYEFEGEPYESRSVAGIAFQLQKDSNGDWRYVVGSAAQAGSA